MTARILHTTITLLSLLLLGGCHPTVYERLDDCPRKVDVALYSQTECDALPNYPVDVTSVLLTAYNDEGEVVATATHKGPVTAETRVRMSVPSPGPIRIAAWSGMDEKVFNLTPGAQADDLFAALRPGSNLTGMIIRQGVSERLTLPSLNNVPTETVLVRINLLELTNRITIHVTGLEEPEKIIPEVTSANDRYSGLGKLLGAGEKSTPYSYPLDIKWKPNTYTGTPEPNCKEPNGELTVQVTTLALRSGHRSLLTMRREGTFEPIYVANLVGLVLMAAKAAENNGDVNLHCTHDLFVEMKVRRCPDCSGGYEMVEIEVNGWKVHSYDIDLGQ